MLSSFRFSRIIKPSFDNICRYHAQSYKCIKFHNQYRCQPRKRSKLPIIYKRALSHHKRDEEKPSPWSKSLGLGTSLALGASFLVGKTKYVLVALKLTKAAPLASMVITSFAYSFFFGWQYAVGMVGLILCHESGHALVMRHYGVPFSPMVFVPFMGAVIAMKESPKNSYEEAMIAFGGPVVGSMAALGLGVTGAMTDSQLLLALADFGYMINLFNMLPIGSMDGGRIGNAIHPMVGVVGLAGGGFLIYLGAIGNPIFYLIMLSGAYTTGSRLFGFDSDNSSHSQDYYKISAGQQAGLGAGYLALIGALLMAMNENNKHRKTPRQLQRQTEETEEGRGGGGWDNDFWKEKEKDGALVYDDYFRSQPNESSSDRRS